VPKLPKELTTVTHFSKTIALLLVIALPFLGFYVGTKYRETDVLPKESSKYSKEQLYTQYSFGEYNYVLVRRASLNIPIRPSTDFAGVLRKSLGSNEWKEFLEIKSVPNSAKNNPYELWQEGKDLFLLIVDHNGAGSGEGTAKLIKISGKKTSLAGCFYFVPENILKLNDMKQIQLQGYCDNYEIILNTLL